MQKSRNSSLSLVIIAIAATSSGCGTSSSTSAVTTRTELDASIGSLVVTSPTAVRSSTTASLGRKQETWVAKLGREFNRWVLRGAVAADAASDVKPFSEMVEELETKLDSATPAEMVALVGTMSTQSGRAACYGPSWTDDARVAGLSRPSGDLGIVSASASATDATACAAAELNALIAGSPQFANKLIKLQATIVAALEVAGKSLPAIGESINALAYMPSAPGLTFSVASLARLADTAEGYVTYKTMVTFKDASLKEGSATIYHTAMNADNSNFKGLVQAILPHTANGGAGTKRGMSVVYQQTAGVLTYALDTAANRSTDSIDFFKTSNGRVDFSKTAFGEDGNRIIASFDSNTNAVTMHYAWQAGSQDGSVRAFAINIPAGTEGALTGVAYFGFGGAISSLTDDVSSPWMTGMYCDWLDSPRTLHAEVQGQTFSQKTAANVFSPDVNKINFKPVNACTGSDYTVSAAQPSTLDGSRSGTKDLTTVGGLGTIPAVTVPSYTIPSS